MTVKGIPRVPAVPQVKSESAWLREGAGREPEFAEKDLSPRKERKKREKRDLEPVLVRIPRELFIKMKQLIDEEGVGTPVAHWVVEAISRRVKSEHPLLPSEHGEK